MKKLLPSLAALLGACAAPDGPSPADTDVSNDTDETSVASDSDGTTANCDYPAGAVEPMTLGEVLSPYSWPRALHGDGRDKPLDLSTVPCGGDEEIDWSPFDLLLFVSIPAW